MKKIFFAALAILILCSCSSVSQSDYDSVVKERDNLKNQVEELERKALEKANQDTADKTFSTEPTFHKSVLFDAQNKATVTIFENENPKSASVLCNFDGENPELEYARILAFMLMFDKLEIKDYMVSSMVEKDNTQATIILCKNGELQPSVMMSEKYKVLSDEGITMELQEISLEELVKILERLTN